MDDEILFHKYDLSQIVENHRRLLSDELDKMSDSRLLNTDLSGLQDYALEKFGLDLPTLGEPLVDEERTKMRVGRYGGFDYGRDGSVEVDAQRYTLEIPFEGDPDLFFARGSTFNMNPPRGTVRGQVLAATVVEREPSADKLNQVFESFLKDVNQHLGWLKGAIDGWNGSIASEVAKVVEFRQEKARKAGSVASGLKFGLKQREDTAATYVAAITPRKRVSPQPPKPVPSPSPEPVLSNENYREILDTLKDMSQVMERSPHAFSDMDEEQLRFHFLVPLNAKFKGDARAEVFNYQGKTDILITEDGANIFIGECKFWKGKASLSKTVDQLLGYTAWRDTKCAILLFNRNKNFTEVLDQIEPVMESHGHFVSFNGVQNETEFGFTFARPDDPARKITLTVLAFDIPAK